MMKIVSQRDLIRDVAARWEQAYRAAISGRQPNAATIREKTKQQIYDELRALDGEIATAEDVAAIIGNDSWCALTCSECDAVVKAIVRVEDEPSWDRAPTDLCFECVHKAQSLVDGFAREELLHV